MSHHKEDEHNGAVDKERAARHALTGHAQNRIVEAAVEAPEVGPFLERWYPTREKYRQRQGSQKIRAKSESKFEIKERQRRSFCAKSGEGSK